MKKGICLFMTIYLLALTGLCAGHEPRMQKYMEALDMTLEIIE